jgi:hypothetical protein
MAAGTAFAGSSADSVRKNMIGVELAKPLYLLTFRTGYAGELAYKRRLNEFFYLRSTLNYTSYNRKDKNRNTIVGVKGFCFKQGVDFVMNPENRSFNVLATISPYIALFNNSRTGKLDSDFYQDYYTEKISGESFVWGFEPAFRMHWTILPALATELTFRGNLYFIGNSNKFKIDYVPGTGRGIVEGSPISMTAGMEWKLFYCF